MVGSLRAKHPASQASPVVKGHGPQYASAAMASNEQGNIGNKPNDQKPHAGGIGKTVTNGRKNSGTKGGAQSEGTSSNEQVDEGDEEDGGGEKPDETAPFSGSVVSAVDYSKTYDGEDNSKQLEGINKDQGTGPTALSTAGEQKQYNAEEKTPLIQLPSESELLEGGSISSASPEPDFDIAEDDDDYGEVDAVSQSSAESVASEDSETFEEKEQNDFEIDWNDPATFDYEGNTFTSQHRFSVHDQDLYEDCYEENDILSILASKSLPQQNTETLRNANSGENVISSVFTSAGSSSDSSRSTESPLPVETGYELDDGDITDECEFECDGESSDGPRSNATITPTTPYSIKKVCKPADEIPPPPMDAFAMPPLKRFAVEKNKIVASTGRGPKPRSLQYYWPRNARLSMISGSTTGNLRPHRHVQTKPLKQIESSATPGMAEIIRPWLFRQYHFSSSNPMSRAARGPTTGLYGNPFFTFANASSFAVGLDLYPSLDFESQSNFSGSINSFANGFCTFEDIVPFEDYSLSDTTLRPPLTRADADLADSQRSPPMQPTGSDGFLEYLVLESDDEDDEVDLKEMFRLASKDEKSDQPAHGDNSPQHGDRKKRQLEEVTESDGNHDGPSRKRHRQPISVPQIAV